jgi:hypothetical protein
VRWEVVGVRGVRRGLSRVRGGIGGGVAAEFMGL